MKVNLLVHLIKTVLSLLLMLFIWSPAKSYAQGWTSVGGGSGVVCFNSENSAKNADEFIAKNQPFAVNLIDKIESVEALDYFEAGVKTKEAILEQWGQKNPDFGNWNNLYHSLIYRIKTLAPLFGLTLDMLESKMHFSDWQTEASLALLQDQYNPTDSRNANLGKQIATRYPRCRVVQLVKRYSLIPQAKEVSLATTYPLPEYFFAFEIHYVKVLFDKMDSLNKALLFLHEQLYLMGTPLGHLSSDDTRYWVREFALLQVQKIYQSEERKFLPTASELFDYHCKETENNHCYKPPPYMRSRMTSSFGDYALYFFRELEGNPNYINNNPFYKVFIDALLRSRKFMNSCMGPSLAGSVKQGCYQKLLVNVFSSKTLNDTENLFYLAWFIYGNQLELFNYEYLVSPDQTLEFTLQWGASLKFLCEKIAEDSLLVEDKSDLIVLKLNQAQAYCTNQLKIPRK